MCVGIGISTDLALKSVSLSSMLGSSMGSTIKLPGSSFTQMISRLHGVSVTGFMYFA